MQYTSSYPHTTAPTDHCFNPAEKNVFVVSYVIVFAFNPKLNLDRVIIQRSFGHSLKTSKTIDYLTSGEMECINVKLVKQLKDCHLRQPKKFQKRLFLSLNL